MTESGLPYGAPQFDRIRNEHYLPAFEEGIRQAKAEIDAIVSNPDEPSFENTIEALEYSGRTLSRVSGIFYNINEADTDDEMQSIAEQVSPMMTEYSMYVSLNSGLFDRVKSVYDRRESLSLENDQRRLLEETYRSFTRNGAGLSPEDKELFSRYSEELSLLSLQFHYTDAAGRDLIDPFQKTEAGDGNAVLSCRFHDRCIFFYGNTLSVNRQIYHILSRPPLNIP